MTLDELSRAWQSMRDAVLGRSGFEEHGSPELAARVRRSYAAWREFSESAGMTEDMAASVSASAHVSELRELQRLASTLGVRPAFMLPETPLERLGALGGNALLGVAMFGAGLLVFYAVKNGR